MLYVSILINKYELRSKGEIYKQILYLNSIFQLY